jgi:membrane associated rhomboid family serine protease
MVPAASFDAAIRELRQYEAENLCWPPPPPQEQPSSNNLFATVWVLITLAIFHDVTLTRVNLMGHVPVDWLSLGNAHAGKIIAGEWWRLATALTLHSGWLHLLSNLLIGGIFIVRLCRDLGTGLGWSLLLASGISGNLLNAWLQSPGHRAVGASTAIFGAVGLLAAISLVRYRHNLRLQRRLAIPVAAAFGLLAMLGAGGEQTDLGAHLFGFLFGLIFGGGTEVLLERRGKPGNRLNALLALSSAGILVAAWYAALRYGS